MSKERDFGVDGEPEHAHGISHGPRFHGESPVVHVIITLGTQGCVVQSNEPHNVQRR